MPVREIVVHFVGGTLGGTYLRVADPGSITTVEVEKEYERYERDAEPFAKLGALPFYHYNFKGATR